MKSIAAACVLIAAVTVGAYMVLGEQPFGAADRTSAPQSVRLD